MQTSEQVSLKGNAVNNAGRFTSTTPLECVDAIALCVLCSPVAGEVMLDESEYEVKYIAA